MSEQTLLDEADGTYKRLKYGTTSSDKPMKYKPQKYDGKGSVASWTTHVNNCYHDAGENYSPQLAVGYITHAAHEWYIAVKGGI